MTAPLVLTAHSILHAQSCTGSNAHRFRSTKEFLPHAKWLLTDATLDTNNCECKYCTGAKRAVPTREGAYRKDPTASRPLREIRGPPTKRTKPSTLNVARVKTQTLLLPGDRPTLGVTVPSAIMRDNELARQARAAAGHCEGYRQGEIVWVRLEEPVCDPTDAARQIDKWPAQIIEITTEAKVQPATQATVQPSPQSADPRRRLNKPQGEFNLEGRVTQECKYSVVLIGSPEDQARVSESQLEPFLSGFINNEIASSSFGKSDNHAWLDSPSGMPSRLFLLGEEARQDIDSAEWGTRLAALAFSVTACNYMRCRYRRTDPFEVLDIPGFPNSNSSLPSARSRHPSGRPAIPNESNARYSAASSNDNDGEIRSSLAERSKVSRDAPTNQAQIRLANNASKSPNSEAWPKPARYWQGMYLGVERIWVGDLVRLKLAEHEVKDMLDALAASKRLARKSDAKPAGQDLKGSYAMRLRAIYDEATATSDSAATTVSSNPAARGKSRIVGSVYQVMTTADFHRRRAEERKLYDERAQKALESADPFAGMVKKFAFPKLDILSSWGLGAEMLDVVHLQPGFHLSPVTAEGHEVILDPLTIAGRMYPSLVKAEQSEFDLLSAEALQGRLQEDTQDPEIARLAVAGALPGFVKAMGVDDQARESGEALMKMCFDVSRGEIKTIIKAQEAEENIRAVSAAAVAQADVVSSTDQSLATTTSSGKRAAEGVDAENGHVDGIDGDRDPKRMRSREEGEVTAAAATPGGLAQPPPPAVEVSAVQTSSNSSAASAQPHEDGSTASKALSGEGEATSAAGTSSATAQEPGRERLPSPPLPPGWVKKASRSGHGFYYANRSTKQTSWDRPTA